MLDYCFGLRLKALFISLGFIFASSCGYSNSGTYAEVGGIPLVYVEPKQDGLNKQKLVIWQNGFTGRKEDMLPQLRELAEHGFLAISYDNYAHGARALDHDSLWRRVFAVNQFRKQMWPIIGHSVEDASKVIDWAILNLNVDPDFICIGGYSMGGDIAVAVAGIDKRIRCVAAIASTPEWTRPLMQRLDKKGELVKQGKADLTAQDYYRAYNPASHIKRYSHLPAITFESGRNDVHIPAADAELFVSRLREEFPTISAQVILHDGGHTLVPSMWANSLGWFKAHLAR